MTPTNNGVFATLALNFSAVSHRASNAPMLVKENRYLSDVCEAAPFVFKDKLLLMECMRPAHGEELRDYYLVIKDLETDEEIVRFATGYGLASLWVHQDVVYVFASRWENERWNDVALFRSSDLQQWNSQCVLEQEPNEHIFNTSVCAAGDKFVMAYETDDPHYVPFTAKFAESSDLVRWRKIPDALFGPDKYAACPCLRYLDGWYYMLYLEHKKPAWRFETFMVRSQDLKVWQPSPRNPILAPESGEDINTSDPDLAEYQGKVHLYYSIGDQRTYSKLKRAIFNGTLAEFFKWAWS